MFNSHKIILLIYSQSPFRIILELDENIASNWDLYLITILTLCVGLVIYVRRPHQDPPAAPAQAPPRAPEPATATPTSDPQNSTPSPSQDDTVQENQPSQSSSSQQDKDNVTSPEVNNTQEPIASTSTASSNETLKPPETL